MCKVFIVNIIGSDTGFALQFFGGLIIIKLIDVHWKMAWLNDCISIINPLNFTFSCVLGRHVSSESALSEIKKQAAQ